MTREEAIKIIRKMLACTDLSVRANLNADMIDACHMAIKELEQEPNTWSLDDARDDFKHDVYNTLDFLPTNNEANQIIDSFDRVTSSIKQEPKSFQWCETCKEYDQEKHCCHRWSKVIRNTVEEMNQEQESIIGKIRAEIEKYITPKNSAQYDYEAKWQNAGLRMALEIIDKYNAESEDK